MPFWFDIKRGVIFIGIAAMMLCHPAAAHSAPDPAKAEAYRYLAAQDLRLASIAYRLAHANREFCADKQKNYGWVLHDIAQYKDQKTVKAVFGFSTPIQISGIIPGGPASAAGLSADDGIVSVFSQTAKSEPGTPVKKGSSYARLGEFKSSLQAVADSAPDGGAVMVTYTNGGGPNELITIRPTTVCSYDIQIDTANGLSADADGKIISVTLGMVQYVLDDAQLAAVVAHEMAHNLLRHREKLDQQKVKRGIGRMFGKSKQRILASEIEADQLSVWLMINAGYDPRAAIDFWARYGPQHNDLILSDGTHLSWEKRISLLQKEIDTIAATPKPAGGYAPPLLMQNSSPTNMK
jgi:beta-barrel assembly-enhancing protease